MTVKPHAKSKIHVVLSNVLATLAITAIIEDLLLNYLKQMGNFYLGCVDTFHAEGQGLELKEDIHE